MILTITVISPCICSVIDKDDVTSFEDKKRGPKPQVSASQMLLTDFYRLLDVQQLLMHGVPGRCS